MPLLQHEPVVFPEGLFDCLPEGGQQDSSRWWVIHTKPREKPWRDSEPRKFKLFPAIVAEKVAKQRPLVPLVYHSFQAICSFMVKIVPGLGLGKKPGCQGLFVENQRELHANLVQVHRLITSGLPSTPETILLPGAIVEILSGPLAGLRGKLYAAGVA